YRRRREKMLADLAKDQKLKDINAPTPFTKLTFRRDQLTAVLEGKPVEEINKFKRPYFSRKEKAGAEPSSLVRMFGEDSLISRWVLGHTMGYKQQIASDEEEVAPEDLVSLWFRHEEPLKEAAHNQESIRRINEL